MFTDLEQSKYFSLEYKSDNLDDLVSKIQKGDQKARQELYQRLNLTIVNLSKIYESEYRSLESDWGEFYFAIINATEKAIECFDTKKGTFVHFWRKIIKFEKIRLIRNRKANKRIQSCDTIYIGQETDAVAEMIMYQYGEKENFSPLIDKLYAEELMDDVMNFVTNKYGNDEHKMLFLWLQCYSLEEIADSLDVNKKYILSRLYTIINSIRRNFNCENYI
jgi:DNA-directed RNA polymerase specialized sigma24 family protein